MTWLRLPGSEFFVFSGPLFTLSSPISALGLGFDLSQDCIFAWHSTTLQISYIYTYMYVLKYLISNSLTNYPTADKLCQCVPSASGIGTNALGLNNLPVIVSRRVCVHFSFNGFSVA